MKVVLAGICDPRELVDISADRFKESLFVDFLTRNVIISSSNLEISSCIKELCSGENKNRIARIVELYKRIPLTEKSEAPPVDFRFEPSGQNDLSEIPILNYINKIRQDRDPVTQQGQSRIEIYNKVLRPFSTTAKGVFALDPYVVENYMEQRNDSLIWTLENFIQDGIQFINIYTRLWNANNQFNYDPQLIKKTLIKDLSGLFKNKLGVKIKFIFGFSNHLDRHFRFYYDSQRLTPSISFGKGFSVFESEKLKSAHSITVENAKTAYNRESEIEHSRNRSTLEIVL